jgi:hypothetical protein
LSKDIFFDGDGTPDELECTDSDSYNDIDSTDNSDSNRDSDSESESSESEHSESSEHELQLTQSWKLSENPDTKNLILSKDNQVVREFF